MKTVNDESIEAALNFLRDTSKDVANAKAMAKYLEQKRKSLKAAAFLEAQGQNIAERESKAYRDDAYLQCIEDYKSAVYDFELLENQRRAAELRIEVWRTINANNRRGNI